MSTCWPTRTQYFLQLFWDVYMGWLHVEMSSPRSGGVRADMSVRWWYTDVPAAKSVIGCSSYLFPRRWPVCPGIVLLLEYLTHIDPNANVSVVFTDANTHTHKHTEPSGRCISCLQMPRSDFALIAGRWDFVSSWVHRGWGWGWRFRSFKRDVGFFSPFSLQKLHLHPCRWIVRWALPYFCDYRIQGFYATQLAQPNQLLQWILVKIQHVVVFHEPAEDLLFRFISLSNMQ